MEKEKTNQRNFTPIAPTDVYFFKEHLKRVISSLDLIIVLFSFESFSVKSGDFGLCFCDKIGCFQENHISFCSTSICTQMWLFYFLLPYMLIFLAESFKFGYLLVVHNLFSVNFGKRFYNKSFM